MKTQAFTCILLLQFSYSKSHLFEYALIKDYLKWNNIKAVLFSTCSRSDWSEPNKVIKSFEIDDIFLNHWDMSKKTNISHFNYQHFFRRSTYPVCVVVDCECNETLSMLPEISERTLFHYERFWLMFGRNVDKMFNVLSQQYINVDAEVAMVVPVSENEYEIDEIYNPSVKRMGRFRMGRIGTWNRNMGLKMNEMESKYDRRHNLDNVTLFAAITIPRLPPNKTFAEHINADEYLYMDNMSKSNYRVFQILNEMFNFKMTVRRGRIWGALLPNGSWIGVVGLLNRSEIDISISGLRWESDRCGVFDQTTNSFYVHILFIFRHPKIVDANAVFLSPFDLSVWLFIIAVGCFVAVVIKQSFILENTMKLSIPNLENETTYGNTFLMAFGIFFQQGYAGEPVAVSSRIFSLTIFMFAVIMFQFYGSFIVGSLLTEAPKTIKTVKQLLKTNLDFAMDELPYIQDTFSHVIEESAVEMYNKIIAQPKPFLPLFTGLDLIKKGTMAFNTDGIFAFEILKKMLTDNEFCELQTVKYVGKVPTGPGLPKRSPFRELIKIGIRKLHETGIIAYVWKTWIAQLGECVRSDVEVVPVDMLHFSSALYVLGFGIQISFTIFLGELFAIYYFKLRKRNKTWLERNKE